MACALMKPDLVAALVVGDVAPVDYNWDTGDVLSVPNVVRACSVCFSLSARG